MLAMAGWSSRLCTTFCRHNTKSCEFEATFSSSSRAPKYPSNIVTYKFINFCKQIAMQIMEQPVEKEKELFPRLFGQLFPSPRSSL